jgi:hypothetical protein
MHYLDQNGQWIESHEQIDILNGVAVARQGQHQVIFSASPADVPAIDLQMPDGRRLQSRVAGIAYFDGATGQSAWVALIHDVVGQVHDPNVVIYPAAFGDDLHADIRCTYTKSGFEQDLLLREQLLDPAALNPPLDANTVLVQLWTEFFSAPAPQKQELVVYQENDPAKRQQMAVPDLVDEYLDFGGMQMGQGVAFSLSENGDPMDPQGGVRVCKSWVDDPATGRHFLVETVPYAWLQPLTQGLPPKQAALNKPKGPLWAKVRPNRSALLASLPKPERNQAGSARPPGAPAPSNGKMQISKGPLPPQRGVVLDYTTINANKVNFTFQGDTTYYVSGPVILSGSGTGATNTTTFEGGSVLKYSPTNTAKLTVQNRITWQGTSYRPVVMTARDDPTVGDTIARNTITNYDTALYIDAATAGTNAILQNLRVAFATNAIVLNGNTGHVISHAQFVNCQNGIKPVNTIFSLRNALFHNVLNNFNAATANSSTGHCEHVTADTASWLNYSNYLTLNLTNSLLVSVTNTMTFSNTNAVSIVTSTNGVWQAVGAGYHYLADNTYRNLGTTNINASLAADLRKMTTYPPIVLTTDFTASTTLNPQAQRDTDTPDLGWHYDCLDYCWSRLNVTNATVTLTNGVAIGIYGDIGTTLQQGAHFISQGTPNTLNRLARYPVAQEQAIIWGSNRSSGALLSASGGSPGPEARLRFTDISTLGSANGLESMAAMSAVNSTLIISDCWLRGTYFFLFNSDGSQTINLGFTNNIGQRVHFDITQGYVGSPHPVYLYLQNNLFTGGAISLTYYNAYYGTWAAQNNLFDTVALSGSTGTSSYNGYYKTTTLGGGYNKTLTTVDYQTGPLGGYYYPTNGASGGLTNLINAGSTTADLVGLYHYTTSIGLAKETNSIVDIGFHYVATDANGNPIDTNGDGIPDYLQDANGNGVVDSGETDWTSATDPGLKVLITRPLRGSSVP